jgi:PAS domain S-box-containing protein/putative nucleotidyltransferase with HDIG domain
MPCEGKRLNTKKASKKQKPENTSTNTTTPELKHKTGNSILNRRNSSEIYQKLLITSPDAILITNLDGSIVFASERAAHIFGALTAHELSGKSSLIFIAPESRESALNNMKRADVEGYLSDAEYTLLRTDGSRFLALLNIAVIKDENGEALAYLQTVRDVTRHRQMEGKLKRTEENYKKIFNSVNDAIMILDPKTGNIIDANTKAAEMKGCTFEELKKKGMKVFVPDIEDREYKDVMMKNMAALDEKNSVVFEWKDASKKGREQWVEISMKKGTLSGGEYLLAIARDITERKKTEQDIRDSEEMYRSLIDASPDAVFVTDLSGRIIYCSDKAVEFYGAPSMELFLGKNVINFAAPGEHNKTKEFFDALIKTGGAHGVELNLLRYNGEKIIGEANAMTVHNSDGSPKAAMVIMRDITGKKKMQVELQQSYTAVKKIMDGIITAMEKLVEKKDMYTVGHQHRTAQLAKAIAVEMGLPPEQVNCVYISALIHDIGKIFVSGSILNKIGQLTAEEYDIIKKHPEAGYDVLKSIDFPWPIADIILQHHERLNGSGYPFGLKADKIYLESRIISVADVVEAITFARPYRPAFGIDKALEEITSNKGTLFDTEVVDICVSLMKEQGFKFEQNN